ncbi:uncharacterized protein LOC130748416 [Lotus japonicus]|nr:uncharacterized protein LOC130748416 [Lotus japonicus]
MVYVAVPTFIIWQAFLRCSYVVCFGAGDVVLQNVMNATKLMWNPDVPEANSFRDGLALHDIDVDLPIGQIDDGFRRLPTDQDSVSLFPRKSIGELHSTGEEGRFTVMAEIVGLTDGEKWWYTSCHCHRSVTAEDGLYFCSACCVHVFEVTPRFRVKFEVSDGEDLATFVLFDADCQNLINKTCKELVVSSKASKAIIFLIFYHLSIPKITLAKD